VPILNHALQPESVIGLLPTGGGKSLTYQIAALIRKSLQSFDLQAFLLGMKISGEGGFRTFPFILLIFSCLCARQKLTHRMTHHFFPAFL